LPVAGVAAATRAARLLDSLFEEVLIVGGDPPADAPGRRVPDPEGPRCALRGLVGALEAARAERVLVVATDLPLLSPELLLALVAWPDAELVALRAAGHIEPLCAIYSRSAALAPACERLASGRLALQELVGQLTLSVLGADDLRVIDPDGMALANANTPEEWVRIEARLRGGG
jgi:molybdopterin-guanine dinucleotide biosynthesis protein A